MGDPPVFARRVLTGPRPPFDPVEAMLPSLQGVRLGGEPLFADVQRHERIAVGRDHLRVTRVAVPAIIEARRGALMNGSAGRGTGPCTTTDRRRGRPG